MVLCIVLMIWCDIWFVIDLSLWHTNIIAAISFVISIVSEMILMSSLIIFII